VLETLNGSASASCIAPIGWSKLIFTGADSVSSPNTIGFGDRDETLCKLDQIQYLEDTHYLRLAGNPHYVEHVLPNKSLQARVGANPSLWDTLGYVHAGYTTLLQILPSLEPTTVSIMSRVNTLFNWVESNAVGDEWHAHVSAAARLWAGAAGALPAAPRTVQRGARRPMTLTDFKQRGRIVATLCEVAGLGHAWSGGAANQPYADPTGPDASRLIWAFAARAFSATAL